MKQRSRKAVVKQLDKVFGDFIKLRDRNTCVVCGARRNIQCGHLYTRASYSTRWDEENCWAQCAGCNLIHEHRPKHMEYAVAGRGIDVDKLFTKHCRVKKYTTADLEEMILYYKNKLADAT